MLRLQRFDRFQLCLLTPDQHGEASRLPERERPQALARTFALTLLCLCVAVGADKQCELTCRPAGYRFYVRLAERVRDGTPCFNVTSNDLCVEGRCTVGAFTFARVWFEGMEPVQGAGTSLRLPSES